MRGTKATRLARVGGADDVLVEVELCTDDTGDGEEVDEVDEGRRGDDALGDCSSAARTCARTRSTGPHSIKPRQQNTEVEERPKQETRRDVPHDDAYRVEENKADEEENRPGQHVRDVQWQRERSACSDHNL